MSGGCLGFLNHQQYVRENPTQKKKYIYIYLYGFVPTFLVYETFGEKLNATLPKI